MATLTAPAPPQDSHRPRLRIRSVVRALVTVALAVLAVQVAVAHRDELTGARRYLVDLNPAWLLVAVGAEATSMLSFTALQRRLLRAGGLEVRMRQLVVITLAGNAIANSLPAGGAFASVFAYRQFRRKGADPELATWTLIAVTGLTAVALGALAVAGVVEAGDENSVGGIWPLIGLLLLGPGLGAFVLVRPAILILVCVPPLRLVRAISGYPKRRPVDVMTEVVDRLEAIAPRLPDWGIAFIYAAGNWVADLTCLATSFLAVGAPVPTRALLLAYGLAQVAANLPVTPGGLGVVEGSLTVALVAFGGSTAATVAAVLVYRILSFWVLLPVGWAAWSGLKLQARRANREVTA